MRRLVHLDLKGAPPKIQYYEQLFPFFRKWGATGLLLEYEDMFPYSSSLAELRSPDAYSLEEVQKLLDLAKKNDLEVIPLVQTFGHLEFVLKHDKFRHLREVERYPNALCPSNEDALNLVKEMISQVIMVHSDIKWIHIGADEVWHLGVCGECSSRKEQKSWTNDHLFLDHVITILQAIRETYPNIIPIMWDDMFRHIPGEILQESGIGTIVEPMVWHYVPDNFRLPDDMWSKYIQIFPNIWMATAFKGATGSAAILTNPNYHIQNHLSWLSIMSKQSHNFQKFRGYAVTGWQRYDHYSVLCELLPVGLPSLAFCLQTLINGEFSDKIHLDTSLLLGFSKKLQLDPFPRPKDLEKDGIFPGKEIFVGVQLLANVQAHYNKLMEHSTFSSCFTPYQIFHNFVNPLHIECVLPSLEELKKNLIQIQSFLERTLSAIYYPSTVEEWMAINVNSYIEKVIHLHSEALRLIDLGARIKDYGKKSSPEMF